MELYRLLVVLVALVPLVAADASSSMSAYWSKTLPMTPMPTMIKDMTETVDKTDLPKPVVLIQHACVGTYLYYTVVDQQRAKEFKAKVGQTFFLLKETSQGSTIRMLWLPTPKTGDTITFLPRHEAESIPFSSEKLPEIYKLFSVNPKSETAKIMSVSLKSCETKDRSKDAEDKLCLTSLESMIDFAKLELGGGSDIKVMTSVTKEEGVRTVGKTKFVVLGVKKEVEYGDPMVACHIQPYPYAVFYCHKTRNTAAYTVTLVGGGMRVEALAVCHGDSSSWNPKTLALQVLEVEPGKKDPICHFMETGNLLWVNK